MPFPKFSIGAKGRVAKGEMAFYTYKLSFAGFCGTEEKRQDWGSVCKGLDHPILLVSSVGIDPALMNTERDFHEPQKVEFRVFIWVVEFLLPITGYWPKHIFSF